jgi:hypothetical protein
MELGTAGSRETNAAAIFNGCAINAHALFMSGGPIDAPETIPAGSVDCVSFVTWAGGPVVRQTEALRAEA